MTLPLLLQPGYWFGIYPIPLQEQIGLAMLIVMLLILCVGIGLSVYAYAVMRRDKAVQRAWRWLGTASVWAGIVGLYLYFVMSQRIPVLGMRVWFLVWAGFFGWLIVRGLLHLFRDIPTDRREETGRASYEKWLPKPKK